MSFFIERHTVADHPALLSVWEASVRATHDFLSDEDIAFYKPFVQEAFSDPSIKLYCIRQGGELVAFLGVSADKIEMLFAHPRYHGRGLGKALLSYAIENLGLRAVDVNDQNGRALRFYERFGFRTVSRSAVDGTGRPYPILHLERPSGHQPDKR